MSLSKFDAVIYNFLDKSPIDFSFYHPYLVDFALVLPMAALFFHFISVLTNNKEYLNASTMLFFIGFGFIIFAYLTGIAHGPEVKEVLSVEGKGLYDAHSQVASALLVIFFLLSIAKVISLLVDKVAVRYIFGTLFFITILVLFYQDTLGNGLVFDYGAGVSTSPY